MFVRLLCILAFALAAPYPAYPQTAAADGGSGVKAVLIVGDSLSAEYGLRRGTGWPELLRRRMAGSHPAYRVVNASISGDTTSGGASRLPALLAEHRPAVVVLELGSNDALRGLSLSMTRANLAAMAKAAREAGARVLVVGMQIPPNYGQDYTERFRALFGEVAREQQAGYVPFLLEGIAADRAMFQADGMHPTEDAQPRLLENVWKALEPLLSQG